MTSAEEYRRLAQECLVTARSASIYEARAALVKMASTWFRLAEEQDNDSADRSVPPPISKPAQPPAQQQQQIQPKDDDNKD